MMPFFCTRLDFKIVWHNPETEELIKMVHVGILVPTEVGTLEPDGSSIPTHTN